MPALKLHVEDDLRHSKLGRPLGVGLDLLQRAGE
jgi:hypothetical protein